MAHPSLNDHSPLVHAQLFLLLWLSIHSGLLVVFEKPNRSSFTFLHPTDLRDKAKRALKAIGSQCSVLGAMQDLLLRAPLPVLKVFLNQFEKVCARVGEWRTQRIDTISH